jgi:hypothetical protein
VKLSRIFIVALAVAAIVAPTAAARPIDWPPETPAPVAAPDMRASVAEALAKERQAQPPLPGPPTWPVNPQPLKPPGPAPAVASDNDGSGVDWATIAIGVGLTFVVLGAIGGLTYLVRAKQRPRVA